MKKIAITILTFFLSIVFLSNISNCFAFIQFSSSNYPVPDTSPLLSNNPPFRGNQQHILPGQEKEAYKESIFIRKTKKRMEHEIFQQVREIIEKGIKEFTFLGNTYQLGISDINGELNSILSKIDSDKRVIIISIHGKMTAAFGKIVGEKVEGDLRTFIFDNLEGEQEISNFSPIYGISDNINTTAIFSQNIKDRFSSWQKLIFNEDFSQANSQYPELERKIKQEVLTLYGLNSLEDVEENQGPFIKEWQESILNYELTQLKITHEIGAEFQSLSKIVNSGDNTLYAFTNILADISVIKNIIQISMDNTEKAKRMYLQWLGTRFDSVGKESNSNTFFKQATTSLLISFIEKNQNGDLVIKFTGENSLQEPIDTLYDYLKSVSKKITAATIDKEKEIFKTQANKNLDEEFERQISDIKERFKSTQISPWLLELAFWVDVYNVISENIPAFDEEVKHELDKVTDIFKIAILKNFDVAGDYTKKSYQNLSQYIIDRASDIFK